MVMIVNALYDTGLSDCDTLECLVKMHTSEDILPENAHEIVCNLCCISVKLSQILKKEEVITA